MLGTQGPGIVFTEPWNRPKRPDYMVPAGKRLVVEYASVLCGNIAAGQGIILNLYSGINFQNLPMGPLTPANTTGLSTAYSGGPLTFYVEAGGVLAANALQTGFSGTNPFVLRRYRPPGECTVGDTSSGGTDCARLALVRDIGHGGEGLAAVGELSTITYTGGRAPRPASGKRRRPVPGLSLRPSLLTPQKLFEPGDETSMLCCGPLT
jgi:hypothetical protein